MKAIFEPLNTKLTANGRRKDLIQGYIKGFAVGLLFLVLVATKTHGFSITAWHDYIDKSPEAENVFGEYRSVRSDDWSVYLPIIFSQFHNPEKFGITNPFIGTGQKVAVPFRTPVWHWSTIFRPGVWGFFLGQNLGLSWLWWYLVLGNFFGFYLLVKEICPRLQRETVAILGLLYISAPYMVLWTYYNAEIFLHGLWAVYFVLCYSRSRGALASLGYAVFGVGSFVAMFIGDLYPPKIVVMGYFLATILFGWMLQSRKAAQKELKKMAILPILYLFVGGVILMAFKLSFDDVFTRIGETVYPGKRFSVGGHTDLLSIFSNWFQQHLLVKGLLRGNICEDAAFLVTFPFTIPLFINHWIRRRARVHRMVVTLFLFLVCLMSYSALGWPDWLAKYTGFFLTLDNRIMIGIGLADILIFCLFLNLQILESTTIKEKKIAFGFFVLILSFVLVALFLRFGVRQLPLVTYFQVLAAGTLMIFVFSRLVFAPSKQFNRWLLLFVGLIYLPTSGFNPLAVGGYEFIENNPLSKAILEIKKKEGEGLRLLVFGNPNLSNLPRMIGVRSLGGYLIYPDKEMNQLLDHDHDFENQLNQVGYFTFYLKAAKPLGVVQIGRGNLAIEIPAYMSYFELLNAQYILLNDDKQYEILTSSEAAGYIEVMTKVYNRRLIKVDLDRWNRDSHGKSSLKTSANEEI